MPDDTAATAATPEPSDDASTVDPNSPTVPIPVAPVDGPTLPAAAGNDDGPTVTLPVAAGNDNDREGGGRNRGMDRGRGAEAAAGEPTPVSVLWRRLSPSGAGAMIGLLVALLGFALVVQVRSNTSDAQLSSARTEDLVRILSDLDAREQRLSREIEELQDTRRQLDSGAQGRDAALAQARRHADEIGILAGTLPAQGPGLSIRFAPGSEPIRAATILDAVQELRGAGAEAMQIKGGNGASVRVVASTYFIDAGNEVNVDGTELSAPYTIDVIGDPQTMQPALNIPGGVVDSLKQKSGSATITQSETIEVTTLHQGDGLKHARPVS